MKPSSSSSSSSARAPAALLLLGASAFPQGKPDAATAELLARVAAARGRSTQALDTLAVEGTFEVRFAEAGEQPIVTGTFRERWAGRAAFRHTSTMSNIRDLERGVADGIVWEIEPNADATVHEGAEAAALQRYVALLRGAPASELYRAVASDGTRELDGQPHVVLKMMPPEGDPDTWWVEPKSARVTRIDLNLPTPRDCVIVFGFPEWSETQVRFAEWKRVDGAEFPCRRVVKCGSMEVAMACTKVERGVTLEPASFELPEAVVREQERLAARDAASPFELIDRAEQPTAAIRLKCKRSEVNATLATAFPEVISYVQQFGAKMAGVPYARYHAVDGELIDFEAGIPVVKAIEGKGRVQPSELPGGLTLILWHFGPNDQPYDQLQGAHEKLRQHAEEQMLKPRGGAWEMYWTDPGMVPDSSKWRTQLFLPVE